MICDRTGKRSYRTVKEAEADIKRFATRSGRQPIKPYQCDACYGFHTTARLDVFRQRQTRGDGR